ncbi:MAG: hypothetical protein ABFS56_05925 [Pseudomonadota bacterium]
MKIHKKKFELTDRDRLTGIPIPVHISARVDDLDKLLLWLPAT